MWDSIKPMDIHKMGFPRGEEVRKKSKKRENKLGVKTFSEITKYQYSLISEKIQNKYIKLNSFHI